MPRGACRLGLPPEHLLCWAVALAALGLGGNVGSVRAEPPAEAKSSPQAIRQYRDAVTFQNRELYDLAAEEWEKFLEKFPRDPAAAKAEHYLGVCRLKLKQYDAAEKAFKHVASAFPNFDLLDVSYLDLGITQYVRAQANKAAPADALETFAELVKKFPQSKQLGEAYYYLGESLYAAGRKAEAADAFAKAIDKDAEKKIRPEALNALGVVRQDLEKPAEAGAVFDQFLKEYPDHALKGEVTLHRAETLFALGKYAEAQQGFAAARAIPDFFAADLAMLREAECLAQQKKYAEAAALDVALIDRYPQSAYAGAARLAAGNSFYSAGAFADAEKWLAKVASAGGADAPEAAHWLARAYLKQSRPADAQKVVEQALPAAGPSPYAVDLELDRADSLYDSGQRRQSIPLFAALAKQHPDHAAARTALYMAAFASLGEADYPAAGEYAGAFLKRFPDGPLASDARYVAAEAKLLAGDYPAAIQLYDALLAKEPNGPDSAGWKLRRATALLLAQKYAQVVSSLRPQMAAFNSPEQKAEAHFLVGSAELDEREADAAAKEFSLSLAAAPRWRQADETLLQLAAAYRKLNKLPDALATARKVAADFPDSRNLDRAWYRVGEYSAAAGDYRAAQAAYQTVIDRWPDGPFDAYALYGLGWADLEIGEPAKAEEAFTRLIERHPQDALAPRARGGRARARQSLKKYDEAIADTQAYLKSDPAGVDRSDAIFVGALASAGLGKNAQAIQAFESILKQDPGYNSADRVLYELAFAQLAQKQEDAAAATFARLAQEHPDSPLAPESSYRVGEQEYQAKRYAKAAEAYVLARDKAGKSELGEKAAYKLAWACFQDGQFDRARQAFERVLDAFPAGPHVDDAQFMAAECLFKLEKYQPAFDAYQKFVDHPSPNKDSQFRALLHAGQAAGQLRRWNDGVRLLQRAAKEFPDDPSSAEVSFELAACKQNLGDEAAAYKLYEKAAEADREVGARARFMMGEILFGKKDFHEGVKQFMKVAYGYGYPSASDAVKKWQADAMFESGRCFENMRQIDQAKKSYTEVIEKFPHSPRAAAAKARLEALGS